MIIVRGSQQIRDPEPVLTSVGVSTRINTTNTKSTPAKNRPPAGIPLITHNYKNSLITNIQTNISI